MAACVGPAVRLPETAAGPPALLLLASVAGLTAEDWQAGGMPTLASLAAAGVAAQAVHTTTPAATYPAHATLVTGLAAAGHGIPTDHLLGEKGVRAARYSHASLLRAPTLWQRASEVAIDVASLDWPSTLGAAIPTLLPDVSPSRKGETWLSLLRDGATADALEIAERYGAGLAETNLPGPGRDAVLVGVACEVIARKVPPRLLLMRLTQTAPALAAHGPGSAEATTAFRGADRSLARLLGCLRSAGLLETAALVVVGDHGTVPVHTTLAPNVLLVEANLVAAAGANVLSWRAISRSNGGSAFVYANGDRSAIRARNVFLEAAARTRAFRVTSAQELLSAGADPEAWFGLQAEPGFVFVDRASGALESPSVGRGAGGYLPGRGDMETGLVAWGHGIRTRVRIPTMHQNDVAPTLARLLGFELAGTSGRPLVGALRERVAVSTGPSVSLEDPRGLGASGGGASGP